MHSLPVSRHFLFVTVSSVAVHVMRCLEIVVINIAFLSRWKLTFIRNNFLSNHLFVLFLFYQISWIQLNKVYGKLHPTHFLNNSPSLPKPFCIFSIPIISAKFQKKNRSFDVEYSNDASWKLQKQYITEAHWEPCQTSKTEPFTKM